MFNFVHKYAAINIGSKDQLRILVILLTYYPVSQKSYKVFLPEFMTKKSKSILLMKWGL